MKRNNNIKNIKNDSDSPKFENKENRMCSYRKENNQKFHVINEEHFRKGNIEMLSSNNKLKSNISKKIKNILKSSDEF